MGVEILLEGTQSQGFTEAAATVCRYASMVAGALAVRRVIDPSGLRRALRTLRRGMRVRR